MLLSGLEVVTRRNQNTPLTTVTFNLLANLTCVDIGDLNMHDVDITMVQLGLFQ